MFNGTSCDAPINPIGTRAVLGIICSAFFTIAIILGLTCLRKHGATHLPMEKRFRLVSRRWQWYWLVTTGFCGLVSGVMAIDVDRNYIQSTALILQCIFYYVTMPVMLAGIWEMTRHWYGLFLFSDNLWVTYHISRGSFLERQMIDEDAFAFKQDDKRAKIEFYVPLAFYLFAFLVRPSLTTRLRNI